MNPRSWRARPSVQRVFSVHAIYNCPIHTKANSAASLLGGTSMFEKGVCECVAGEAPLVAVGADGGAAFFHLPALLDVAARTWKFD